MISCASAVSNYNGIKFTKHMVSILFTGERVHEFSHTKQFTGKSITLNLENFSNTAGVQLLLHMVHIHSRILSLHVSSPATEEREAVTIHCCQIRHSFVLSSTV